MKQAIAGVAPATLGEVTVMTVWPSISRFGIARQLGRAFAITWPDLYIFRIGNLLALASIPIVVPLYLLRVVPKAGFHYTLTNRRVLVQRGPAGEVEKSIELDRFDDIRVEVQKGQEWYHAGDLVFEKDGRETFRLPGVSRPEAFRQTCMKARHSFAGVREALDRESVAGA